MNIPVVTIDGPAGTGKGTIAKCLAQACGFYYLDSGLLYRAMAWISIQGDAERNWAKRAEQLSVSYPESLQQAELSYRTKRLAHELLRAEAVSRAASQIATDAGFRQCLLNKQRSLARSPGLVTDGRDMGSVVFPEAGVKFYFTADVSVRVERRVKQLKKLGHDVNIEAIEREIIERDQRDASRAVAPMRHLSDMIHVDTTGQTVDETLCQVLGVVQQRLNSN